MKKRTYTNQELAAATAAATSIRQVLVQLGLAPAGGNYSSIRRRIAELQLDNSHFRGQGWRKGLDRPVVQARTLDEVLRKGVVVQSFKLKRRLLSEGLKAHLCESCGLSDWMGNPIPLELHHCNGNPEDNRLSNLLLLCPNCHALTETYRGRKLAKCRGETAPA